MRKSLFVFEVAAVDDWWSQKRSKVIVGVVHHEEYEARGLAVQRGVDLFDAYTGNVKAHVVYSVAIEPLVDNGVVFEQVGA